MKSSIIQAITCLRKSVEFLEDFCRSTKGGSGESKTKVWINKIKWVLLDFKTIPHFNDDVRAAIDVELKSDAFMTDSIFEKVSLLNAEQRSVIEAICEAMLCGEEIKIID